MKNSNVINDFSNQMSTLYSQEWIVQCFTSPPTQYRLYGRRFFTGHKTQPTVSKYWWKIYKRTKQTM